MFVSLGQKEKLDHVMIMNSTNSVVSVPSVPLNATCATAEIMSDFLSRVEIGKKLFHKFLGGNTKIMSPNLGLQFR